MGNFEGDIHEESRVTRTRLGRAGQEEKEKECGEVIEAQDKFAVSPSHSQQGAGSAEGRRVGTAVCNAFEFRLIHPEHVGKVVE